MRRVSAFLRRQLPMILAVLALIAAVVVLWIFSTPIAQRDPPGGGVPLGRSPGGADLRGARLKGAYLSGVHLHGARHLTLEQLCAARARIPAENGSFRTPPDPGV
jgi:hypothetical protein